MNDEIHSQELPDQRAKKQQPNENSSPNKQSDIESQGGRFEFHDDYEAKDEDNPAEKFDTIFDKFSKFTP